MKSEFSTNNPIQRVKKEERRNYLVLSEVLKIEPPEDYIVKIGHIGNLFILDQNKDGRFTLKEIIEFAKYCRDHSNTFKR